MSLHNPTSADCGCEACRGNNLISNEADGGATGYVYAVGTIEARFPTIGVEKEFAQATGRAATANLSDRKSLHALLTAQPTQYLARQLCYVLSIQGLETYILRFLDSADLQLLVNVLGSTTSETGHHVVIGVRGPLAPPSYCNGLSLPMVTVSQVFTIDMVSLAGSIPKPERMQEADFRSALQEVLPPIMQMSDNVGAKDEHRAVNYLTARYPALYARVAEAHAAGAPLAAVEVSPSRLTGSRKVVSIVYSCVSRKTGVADKFFARVDVTEQFPFLVTGLSPYFDR
jgi:hypothetical protein